MAQVCRQHPAGVYNGEMYRRQLVGLVGVHTVRTKTVSNLRNGFSVANASAHNLPASYH